MDATTSREQFLRELGYLPPLKEGQKEYSAEEFGAGVKLFQATQGDEFLYGHAAVHGRAAKPDFIL